MKAILLLSDGTVFKGRARGKCENVAGEVVFNTSMVGYQEILTDPDYKGQLVAMTFPLMGNYGINDEDVQSDKVHLKGFITRDITDFPSNFRLKKTLDEYLKENNVTAIEGIDTRALTRLIREKGCLNGKIITGDIDNINLQEELRGIITLEEENYVPQISVKDPVKYDAKNAKYNVAVIDFGCKRSVITSLNSKDCNVTLLPYNVTKEEIGKLNPDGIVISNGPGDPKALKDILANIKEITDMKLPVFGIGLGHLVIALSMGFDTEKMKYGHRGASQPVKDVENGKTYITTQSHGYVVKENLVNNAKISHININDNTIEGIIYEGKDVFTVQFNAEVSSNTVGTTYLFDKFLSLMEGNKNA